ncbi:kelch-like protein 28 [Arctopsyche grandis]|uniref:kelch-like protein 28 n=1 Tax=Arctopsyche grandis TaxID=121162 RepID=UPI00406D8A81
MCDSEKMEMFNNFYDSKYTLDGIYQLMLERQFCDVQISINGNKTYAHSVILAVSSDYFKSNLTKNKTDMYEIHFDDVNEGTMKVLIEYCYTKSIKIYEDNVKNILKLAGFLQITPVVGACCRFLAKCLNTKNCFEIIKLSKLHSSHRLEQQGMDFAKEHFKEVIRSEDFVKLDLDQLAELIHCEIDVSSDVWSSVKRWLDYDSKDRMKYLCTLLSFTKLSLIPSQVFLSEIYPLCKNDPTCVGLVSDVARWQIKCGEKLNVDSQDHVTTMLAVGSWDFYSSSIVEIYDPTKKNWSKLVDLNLQKTAYSVAIVDENLLFIGGYHGAKYVNDLESYNLKTGERKTLSPMKEPREHPAVAVLGDFLYAFGGYSPQNGFLSTTERYDLKNDTWISMGSLSIARHGCGVAVLNNEIYLVGGCTEKAVSVTEAFNPISGKWRTCASMNIKRMWLGLAVSNGYIYAIGGRKINSNITKKYSSVERYDPIADEWKFVADISSERYGIGGGALGGNIYAVGGGDGSILLTTVEEYDVDKNEWNIMASLNYPREITNIISVPWKVLKNQIKM